MTLNGLLNHSRKEIEIEIEKNKISEGERKPVVIWTDCCRDGKVEEEASEADGDAQGWTMEGAVNHLREFEIYLVALRCGSQT